MFDTRGEHRLSCEHRAYLFPARLRAHPTLQFTAEASFLSCICVTLTFIWIGVRPTSFHAFVPFDEDVAQRNVHWYRRNFPNGGWQLFQGPADVYMVCLTVYHLLGLSNCTIVLASRVRPFASNWWYPQYQVGSQRDRHHRVLLHSTRPCLTDW